MTRKDAANEYKWDFSHLYKSIDDWKKDLNKIQPLVNQISALKGKLNSKENLFKYFDIDLQIDLIISKLSQYTRMGDTNQSDQTYQELEGLLVNEWQKMNVETSFIAPEFKSIGEKKILDWINSDKNYTRYKFGIIKFFREEKHILSKDFEELLSKVSRSRGAVSDLYDSLAYADRQEEKFVFNGKEQVLNTSLLMEIMENSDPIKDQKTRKEASKVFGKNLSTKKHSFAKIYEAILQRSNESVKIRGYESCLQASLSSDAIPISIYEKLIEVGKKNIQPLKDYSLLIKEKFKFKKFYPTDRQLKLVQEYNRSFTVEQAKGIIKNALSILGKEYLEKLDIAWSKNRVDFYEDTNKRDGAYSTGGGSVEPIILMNWDDKLNSVNTLAHEIGHSVHTLFADQYNEYPLSEYPIILAEVASTVNEHLLFKYMYENAKDKNEKIYLLQQRIFDLVSTFYRQIQFADFEYEAHKLVENEIPLTADIIAKLFKDKEQEYGYDVFEKSENLSYGWPRISHFFHSPFYVYKYAIDVVASYKLFNDLESGNPENIINFLKAGGHKDPLDIMKDSGIDFYDENTYKPLIEAITKMVNELRILIK